MDKILKNVSEDDNGCWVWQRSVTSSGYGQFRVNKKNTGWHTGTHSIRLKDRYLTGMLSGIYVTILGAAIPSILLRAPTKITGMIQRKCIKLQIFLKVYVGK